MLMTTHRLIKIEVVIKRGRNTGMIMHQPGEHLAMIPIGQDALDHHVVTTVECVSRGEVDQADCRIVRAILRPQDLAAKYILTDDGQSVTESLANLPGSSCLAAGTIATDDNEPGGFGSGGRHRLL